MKIVFFGTPEFAVYTLRALADSQHRIALVVTQPDRPRGRGLRLQPSPVKVFAAERMIPILQPETLPDEEVDARLAEIRPDVLVVVAYGLKMPATMLKAAPYGAVNLHGSLLPKYRGAAPLQRAIMQGETVTGVTTMLMDEGWDTGDILLQREIAVAADDNLGTVHDRLAEIGAELMVETLTGLEQGRIVPVPQADELATKAPKIKEEERWIDWSRSSWEIHNLIRALDPVPGALTKRNGQPLRVWRSVWGQCLNNESVAGAPGTVIGEEKGRGLWLRTGDGALLITEVQEEGGKRLNVPAYLAGHALSPGERWGD